MRLNLLFRLCLEYLKKMFDNVVVTILLDREVVIEKETLPTNAETNVVAFLDIYFKGQNVESAPDALGENAGNRFMR